MMRHVPSRPTAALEYDKSRDLQRCLYVKTVKASRQAQRENAGRHHIIVSPFDSKYFVLRGMGWNEPLNNARLIIRCSCREALQVSAHASAGEIFVGEELPRLIAASQHLTWQFGLYYGQNRHFCISISRIITALCVSTGI